MNVREGIKRVFLVLAVVVGLPGGGFVGWGLTKDHIDDLVHRQAEELAQAELREQYREKDQVTGSGQTTENLQLNAMTPEQAEEAKNQALKAYRSGDIDLAKAISMELHRAQGKSPDQLVALDRKINSSAWRASRERNEIRSREKVFWAIPLGTFTGAVLGFILVWIVGRTLDWIMAGFQTKGASP